MADVKERQSDQQMRPSGLTAGPAAYPIFTYEEDDAPGQRIDSNSDILLGTPMGKRLYAANYAKTMDEYKDADGSSAQEKEDRKNEEDRLRLAAALELSNRIAEINAELERIHEEQRLLSDRRRELDDQYRQCEERKQALAAENRAIEEQTRTADSAESKALSDRNEKLREIYPNGKPATVDDPIAKHETKLEQDAVAKYSPAVAAEYEAKGLGKNWDLIQRKYHGEAVDALALQNAQIDCWKAGMPGDVPAATARYVKDHAPGDPYAATFRASDAVYKDAHETSLYFHGWAVQEHLKNNKREMVELSKKAEDVQRQIDAIEERQKKLQTRQEELNNQRQKLQEQQKLNQEQGQAASQEFQNHQKWIERRAQEQQQKLDALLLEQKNITARQQELAASTQQYEALGNYMSIQGSADFMQDDKGGMTVAQFEEKMKESIAKGYIDDGLQCKQITKENIKEAFDKLVDKKKLYGVYDPNRIVDNVAKNAADAGVLAETKAGTAGAADGKPKADLSLSANFNPSAFGEEKPDSIFTDKNAFKLSTSTPGFGAG